MDDPFTLIGTLGPVSRLRSECRLPTANPGDLVLIAEADPARALAWMVEASGRGCHLALGHPTWGVSAWKEVESCLHPQHVIGAPLSPVARRGSDPLSERTAGRNAILIPTGGSSGQVRFAVHTAETLLAAADAFLDRFGREPHCVHASLPVHHVSGLMAVLRAARVGGVVQFGPVPNAAGGPPEVDPTRPTFASVVPTQLRRMMAAEEHTDGWRRFRAVFVGGAVIPDSLLDLARERELPLAPCYGTTESAAMVCVLTPRDFLSGRSGCGEPLPHASIYIRDDTGFPQNEHRTGNIVFRAQSLCHGWWPGEDWSRQDGFATADLGWIDHTGSLRVVGRRDRVIISGGEKIDPAPVEEAILSTGLVSGVAVVGTADPEWGQAVTACYVPLSPELRPVTLRVHLRGLLGRHQIPKRWHSLESLPVNPLGKLDLAALLRALPPLQGPLG